MSHPAEIADFNRKESIKYTDQKIKKNFSGVKINDARFAEKTTPAEKNNVSETGIKNNHPGISRIEKALTTFTRTLKTKVLEFVNPKADYGKVQKNIAISDPKDPKMVERHPIFKIFSRLELSPNHKPGSSNIKGCTVDSVLNEQSSSLDKDSDKSTNQQDSRKPSSEVHTKLNTIKSSEVGGKRSDVGRVTASNYFGLQSEVIDKISSMKLFNIELSRTMIVPKITQAVTQLVSNDQNQINCMIEDRSFGSIEIKMLQDDIGNQATIVVESDNVRAEILKFVPAINENLCKKGVSLVSIEVHVGNNNKPKAKSEGSNKDTIADDRSDIRLDIKNDILIHTKVRDFGYNTIEVLA